MSSFASESSRMYNQSLSNCASYMGTSCAPMPLTAYFMAAHSIRLLLIRLTLSSTPTLNACSTLRVRCTSTSNSSKDVHSKSPRNPATAFLYVPNMGLGPYASVARICSSCTVLNGRSIWMGITAFFISLSDRLACRKEPPFPTPTPALPTVGANPFLTARSLDPKLRASILCRVVCVGGSRTARVVLTDEAETVVPSAKCQMHQMHQMSTGG
mmetsp:Transcript_28445/g.63012  ORF Transcript_28445/g.63012 Transcript_28445/m.63012 type:complete len:213 (+) Transcript_28445:1707-2345(+)